jgi:ATP-binding cassette subfamily B (MDR/TAP) protein 1
LLSHINYNSFGLIYIVQTQKNDINEIDLWEDIKSNRESIDINGDIEFDNVDFVYPSRKDVPVLRNLNLIARAGQTTALVGSSGCGKSIYDFIYDYNLLLGKSTCISLLLHFYGPSSGRITINERSITDYNLKQLRQNIGVVSQEPVCFLIFYSLSSMQY